VGKYDVIVSSGPGYKTAREEATDAMLQVGQNWPAIYEIAGDKIIGGMGFPGAQDISERIAKKLGIQEDGDEQPQMVQGPNGPIPADQAGQLLGQMDHTLQAMQDEMEKLESGMAKAELDSKTAIRVAEINAQAKLDDSELKGMVELLIAKIEPMLAHQAAVVAAADPAHPAAPAPIAQGVQQAPAEAQAADQSHMQNMEAQASQPEPDAGIAPASDGDA
jgi:hypothetical protein